MIKGSLLIACLEIFISGCGVQAQPERPSIGPLPRPTTVSPLPNLVQQILQKSNIQTPIGPIFGDQPNLVPNDPTSALKTVVELLNNNVERDISFLSEQKLYAEVASQQNMIPEIKSYWENKKNIIKIAEIVANREHNNIKQLILMLQSQPVRINFARNDAINSLLRSTAIIKNEVQKRYLATESGIISIKSDPNDSVISIDGIKQSTQTPALIEFYPNAKEKCLNLGEHKIQLSKGEMDWKNDLVVRPYQCIQIITKLIVQPPPKPTTTEVIINNLPDEAKVYVDGAYVCTKNNSPATFSATPGQHAFSTTSDDYFSWEEKVNVPENGPIILKADMEPKIDVEIASTPTGAAVFLDGKKDGTTPAMFELTQGTFNISLTKNGYSQCNYVMYVKHDGEITITNNNTPFYKTENSNSTTIGTTLIPR